MERSRTEETAAGADPADGTSGILAGDESAFPGICGKSCMIYQRTLETLPASW